MQAMWKHRRSVVERGPSGRFGRRGLPLIGLFSVALPLFGPLLDLLTLYGVLFLDRWITLAGWIAVLVLQGITAVLAFRLDRETLRPLWALPLQQFVSDGYAFLVEMLYEAMGLGCRIGEVPIIYVERREGQSKMSRGVIFESVFVPWRLVARHPSWRGRRG